MHQLPHGTQVLGSPTEDPPPTRAEQNRDMVAVKVRQKEDLLVSKGPTHSGFSDVTSFGHWNVTKYGSSGSWQHIQGLEHDLCPAALVETNV